MAFPSMEGLLQAMAMGQARLLFGLDRVPDERLNWSPGGKARTPLQQADYAAGFFRVVAAMIQNRAMPDGPPPPRAPSTTREEAKAGLDEALSAVRRVVRDLNESDLDLPVPMPWGSVLPVRDLLLRGPEVMGYMQGQLNMIQLAYGDTDPNVPPGWGTEQP